MMSPGVWLVGDVLPHLDSGVFRRVHTVGEALDASTSDVVVVAPPELIVTPQGGSLLLAALESNIHVLAVSDERSEEARLLMAGCSGVVPSTVSARQLETMVERIARGELCATRVGTAKALRRLLTLHARPVLTPTEQVVFTLAAEGLPNRVIAERLHIERETVRWHLRSIYSKLGPRALPNRRAASARFNGADHRMG
jgi:DNA-binding NarL/FixJ family response regulator